MNAEPIQVELQVAADDHQLPAGTDIPGWVRVAVGAGGHRRGVIGVRLVDRAESQQLNESYRGQHGPTNVLAFPGYTGQPPLPEPELGDVVICLPVMYSEAAEQGKDALAHLAHLVVHGVLHLLGFDHDDEASARRMERLESAAMRKLRFPDPYLEQ